MNSKEFALKIKMKYPQYAKMDDNELTQKIVQKYPQYKDQIDTDWKGVVGRSVKDMFQKPVSYAKDLGTNPQSMANAMPGALGMVGGMSPVPGGMTMGTAAGQGIRDLSLKALKKPIPGLMQHGLEIGTSVLGDVAAIPGLKRAHFGGQIGEAEKGAGVIARGAEKAITPGSVGQTLRDLEAQLDSGTINTAQGAKDAKEIVDQIYMNPKIYEKSPGISVNAARVSKKVQALLNATIKGREAPSMAMGKAMTIPNAIGRGYQAIPKPLKNVAGLAGAGGAGAAGWELIKKLIGG